MATSGRLGRLGVSIAAAFGGIGGDRPLPSGATALFEAPPLGWMRMSKIVLHLCLSGRDVLVVNAVAVRL